MEVCSIVWNNNVHQVHKYLYIYEVIVILAVDWSTLELKLNNPKV